MTKLGCRCGYIMNLSSDPNPYQNHLINDIAYWETAVKLEEEMMKKFEDSTLRKEDLWVVNEFVRDAATLVFICPKCGRYYVDFGDRTGRSRCYVREDLVAGEYCPTPKDVDVCNTENDGEDKDDKPWGEEPWSLEITNLVRKHTNEDPVILDLRYVKDKSQRDILMGESVNRLKSKLKEGENITIIIYTRDGIVFPPEIPVE